MSARRELLVLERLLWRLSEMARHASTQCSSNAILPLGAERLACQVETLRVIEDQMLEVERAIGEFERQAGTWNEPRHPAVR